MRHLISICILVCLVVTIPSVAQTTNPSTNPSTKPTIAPAAQTMLDQVRDAYGKLTTLELAGSYTLDADAAVYWLARMLEGGEDPLYIARRMVRAASEDIGNADPQALVFAIAVQQTVHFLGMPEAGVALAQLVTYLAAAPKSNAAHFGDGLSIPDVRRVRLRGSDGGDGLPARVTARTKVL